nr:DUF3459 domain-containing protein [Acidobacteriota bacterium]
VRTPMQWTSGFHAGFTTGTPWLPLAAGADTWNVERQRDDPRSMLTLYKRLLDLRRREPALAVGTYRELPSPAGVFAYRREHGEARVTVALNFGSRPQEVRLEEGGRRTVVLSTHLDREGATGSRVKLRGDEGVILVDTDNLASDRR